MANARCSLQPVPGERTSRCRQPALGWALSAALLALVPPAGGEPAPEPAYLVVEAGAAEVFSHHRPALFGVQYRSREAWRGFHPYLIGGVDSDHSAYAGVGAMYLFNPSPRLRISVGTGPGYYLPGRTRRNLGEALEFATNLELSTGVGRGRRLGLNFAHLSNAGLGRSNPGAETLQLVFAVPLR